jgi:hypothetical protein
LNLHLPTHVGLALTKLLGPDWQSQSGPEQGTQSILLSRDATSKYSCPQYHCVSPTTNSFSGATLYRITLATDQPETAFALKYSPNLDPNRTSQIHHFQRALHWELGPWISCPIAWSKPLANLHKHFASPFEDPSNTTLLNTTLLNTTLLNTILLDPNSGIWELMPWLPGTSIPRVGLASEPQILSLSRRLGQLHRAAQDFSLHSLTPSPEPKWLVSSWSDPRLCDRLERLQILVKNKFAKQKAQVAAIAAKAPELDLLKTIEALERCQSIATQSLLPLQALEQQVRNAPNQHCSWGHGDAWRGNWLFETDHVSGLLDFAQADYRWQGFDFARAIGSLLLESKSTPSMSTPSMSTPSNSSRQTLVAHAAWNSAWNAYIAENPSPLFHLEDALQMHRISTVLTLCNLLTHCELDPADSQRLDRLQEILDMVTDFRETPKP